MFNQGSISNILYGPICTTKRASGITSETIQVCNPHFQLKKLYSPGWWRYSTEGNWALPCRLLTQFSSSILHMVFWDPGVNPECKSICTSIKLWNATQIQKQISINSFQFIEIYVTTDLKIYKIVWLCRFKLLSLLWYFYSIKLEISNKLILASIFTP